MRAFILRWLAHPIVSSVIAAFLFSSLTALVAIGQGVLSSYPLETVVSIVGIFVIVAQGLYIFHQRRLIGELKCFDREYELMSIHRIYSLSKEDDSYLDMEYIGERHVRGLDEEIKFMDFTIGILEPLHDYSVSEQPQLLFFEREGEGDVELIPPHKITSSQFAFRIKFHPAIRQGELAKFKYRYKLSKYKTAKKNVLRDQVRNANITHRDYEYNSFKISFPIKKFVNIVEFEPDTCVKRIDINVERHTSSFLDEVKIIRMDKNFRTLFGSNGNFIARIERSYPPLRSKYILKWTPAL
jgi:hypothetical protein